MIITIRWFDLDFANSEAFELEFSLEVDSRECDVESATI